MENCVVRKLILGPNFMDEKHVDYLLKLLKETTSAARFDVNEPHRLSVLFFIISGLDLLGALHTELDESDRHEIIEWIYSYQVDINKVKLRDPLTPNDFGNDDDSLYHNLDNMDKYIGHSGFRATSMIDSDVPFDCGVITMTYCALGTLVILGDDLKRIDKRSIVAGMKHLQLADGSFRPSVLGGERDMRLVYCAAAVCKLLDDWSGIDKDRCAKFIKECLSHEGAFGQCPGAEAHGGSTFCALASLKLMSKLEDTLSNQEIQRLIRWCVNRLDDGFSGRPNKDQDTCYSFWIGSCLVMLNSYDYIDQKRLMEFILLAQMDDGGLGKVPEFFSDPMHTYLGFAGLTFIDERLRAKRAITLRRLDPELNISMRSRYHLENLHALWKKDTVEQSTGEI